ncbi:MAG: hypothetical protein J2P21_27830 [Chloracidobacterium sp.]|nr:hypothetical protein [Chloracidobacterium sp.]
MTDINIRSLDRELKRAMELSNLIHTRSGGQITFHIETLAAFVDAVQLVTGDEHA